ncbi:MAG: phospholipid carrier-dependent glycosyltransferase [Chloroflexi bacterium]|nr:MAG: phospholipid carrier-dependent glycosyltransferase [Chloroflexota bacterium]
MQKQSRRVWMPVFSIFLFLVAFLPRVLYPVARSAVWHDRALIFTDALKRGDFADMIQSPHPGVMTMWLVSIAQWTGRLVNPDYDNLPFTTQVQIEIIPLVLVISLAIVLTFFLLWRLFDWQIAGVVSLLLALDPFHLTISKTLHVDALMSAFVMVSALLMLLTIRQSNRRDLLWSGLFGGLALLTKSPALFLVPFLLLCLGAWQLWQRWENGQLGQMKVWWWETAVSIIRPTLIWLLVAAVIYISLWPAMWVQPVAAIRTSISGTTRHTTKPHQNPIIFMGEVTDDDPGLLYYPVHIGLFTTEVVTVAFVFVLVALVIGRVPSRYRLTLWLCLAFILFFLLQMTIGSKKSARYILPAYQFIIIMAGIGAALFWQWVGKDRMWLVVSGLVVVVVGQTAVSLPRHPYYGTYLNRFYGSPAAILESGVIAGQEQGEGLDLAANYLNNLPLSKLSAAGVQIVESFDRYYHGKTVPLTDDKVDYIVFARNWIMRDMEAAAWQDEWTAYQNRQPKYVVEFDGVPYVWVYKTGPTIDANSIAHPVNASLGQDIRLLGYAFEPQQVQPGETVHLTLYWEAINQPAGDWTVFTHLLDETETQYGQIDSQPQGGKYPTYLWFAGERVQDDYILTVSPDAPAGQAQLAIGMYALQTLERLPVKDVNGVLLENGRILLPGPVIGKQ